MKPLVLGLGNDLLGDDGIGVVVVQELSKEFGAVADVTACNLHGMALFDVMLGYNQAIIIDAIRTGKVPLGTIMELSPGDLRAVPVPSPHYSGLPELIELAGQLELDFPHEIVILAVEIADSQTVGGSMNRPVANAATDLVHRVRTRLTAWGKSGSASTLGERFVMVV